MNTNIKSIILMILSVLVFLMLYSPVVAETRSLMPVQAFTLTNEQLSEIDVFVEEYLIKEFTLLADMDSDLTELGKHILLHDRFSDKKKEKKTTKEINALVKTISSNYGQLIKTRVEYILKIKNILTEEQRLSIIYSLDFDVDYYEDDLPELIDIESLIIPLGLTHDQLKKIYKNRTDLQINALKIELNIKNKMLDLETEMLKDDVNSSKIDELVLGITDYGTKLVDNRVKYILKSKDVLTDKQKKMIIRVASLMGGPGY